MKNKERFLVIGIDAGTFDVIQPMVERGELPAIASIMRDGVWGNLSSTIPSVTSPAWLSCFSGVNPGKLGVFYLTRNSHGTYDEGPPVDVAKIPVKLLWHYLGDHGKKVLCIIPFPFPPAKVNGIMVTNIMVDVAGNTTTFKSYPAQITQEISHIFSSNEVIESKKHFKRSHARNSKEEYLNNVIKMSNITTEINKELSLHLLSRYEWDFFITVFNTPDAIQHLFWSYMDPSHPLHHVKARKMYGNVVYDTYRQVDKAIGDILRQAGDVTVIIVSDHGMGPIHKFFYANRWLMQRGVLKVKGDRSKPSFSMTRIPLKNIAEKVKIRVNHIPNLSIPIMRRKPLPIPEEVDWNRTKAYATIFGININLEGRESQGIVKNDEYDKVCESLREELHQLKDPETGENIIEKVYRREEIYSGPYLEDAPDIVYLFKQPFYYVKKDLFSTEVFKKITSKEIVTANHLNHSSMGIFLAKGPHINSKGLLKGVHITDVAPTILYLMGLPIPKNMDGRFLGEILQQGLITERPPIYVDAADLQEKVEGLSPEEEEKVMEQLRQLGYV
jgi:predicted AlkP superfamily phosphohydrolase/phosphomutase